MAELNLANLVKFYYGTEGKYVAGSHANGIYGCTDKPVVYIKGQKVIGVTADAVKAVIGDVLKDSSNKVVSDIAYNTDTKKLTFTFSDTTTKDVDFSELYNKVTALETAVKAINDALGVTDDTDGSKLEDKIAALEVESTDKTVVVTPGTDGGKTNLAVNIDGETLVKDASTGKISVASKALTVTGKEAIAVADNTTGKEVSLKISSSDQVLTQDTNGLLTNLGLKYISATANTADGTNKGKAVLQLLGASDALVAELDATPFVKDGILSNAELKKGSEITGGSYTADNTYLVLTFNTEAAQDPIVLDVTQLIDIYEAGNGLELTGKAFSIKLVSGDKYLTVTSDGLASNATAIEGMVDGKIKDALDTALGGEDADPVDEQIKDAIEALDVTNIGGAGKYIQVVGQTDGKVTATAQDLNGTAVAVTANGFQGTNVQAVLEELFGYMCWNEVN